MSLLKIIFEWKKIDRFSEKTYNWIIKSENQIVMTISVVQSIFGKSPTFSQKIYVGAADTRREEVLLFLIEPALPERKCNG